MKNILKNLIRIGTVSTINEVNASVKVILKDKNNIVTNELPIISLNEYYIPKVGDLVLCIFLGNDISNGFCLGKYYSKTNIPPIQNKDIYYKDFFSEGSLKYDNSSKTLTLKADNIVIDGDLNITGNLDVSGTIHSVGDITSDGSIIDTTGNTNHHGH